MRLLTQIWDIARRTTVKIARRPLYWGGLIVIPLFFCLMFGTLMKNGLPTQVPVAIVDMDHSPLSREITRSLSDMQMADITHACESYSEAHKLMQSGEIYGYFLIPADFQANLLAARKPTISFYTNMTYYVPASLLYKTFKTTAIYTKAGTISTLLSSAGVPQTQIAELLQPVKIVARPLNNPELNYSIYLCNSFLPGVMQLMIMLFTSYILCEDMKYGTSRQLMRQANGSIIVAVTGRLLPLTAIWTVMLFFMTSLLYRWCGFPMNGEWGWVALSQFLFILASEGFALFIVCVFPNLRLSLSLCALLGVLSFSIAAFSYPVESMYGAIGIFSWILPVRYNFLIYIDQILNGVDIYYSRFWFVAYIIFTLLPFTLLWRLKRAMLKPVYVP